MTETPPVTPDNPTDGGQSAPPTQTDKNAAATQQEVTQQSTAYSYADHRTYSNAMYGQPVWVVDAVFSTDALDTNQQYTTATVQAAIDSMMATTDKQYEETEAV
jgi:hypothetical protein